MKYTCVPMTTTKATLTRVVTQLVTCGHQRLNIYFTAARSTFHSQLSRKIIVERNTLSLEILHLNVLLKKKKRQESVAAA